jgi:hypothetical protein
MSVANAAAASTQPPGHTPDGADDRAVPAHARQLAAQLSTLFDRDVEIAERLNDAQRLLTSANDWLWSRLAPDAFGLTDHTTAATAIRSSPIATLIRNGGPTDNSPMLEALKQARWQIHHAFCAYQNAAEHRRQLAVDVGELSQQLTETLCAAGWSAHEARHANVHELARPNLQPVLHVDRGDYAAGRPA